MTSVSVNSGIDYTQWKLNAQTSEKEAAATSTTAENTTSTDAESDVLSLSHTSGCTDGEDDGKIGFFSAIGNAVKGAAKTAVNGVKSCFTNSEGKFSLGKTLLTAGTAALCIAIPAVGLAACTVGGVMGAVQVGKGIYNAATAETDAEAKSAWQNIGGGGLTVGLSVAGGKASLNAVKSTSTAGINGGSVLDSLSKNASMGQKISALAKDCKSSTLNRIGSIKNFFFGSENVSNLEITEINNDVEEKGLINSDKNTANSAIEEKGLTVTDSSSNSSGASSSTNKIPSGTSEAANSVEAAASSAAAEVEQALENGSIDNASYLKLIKLVHPDKWTAKGISEEQLAYMVELTQKLNNARVNA